MKALQLGSVLIRVPPELEKLSKKQLRVALKHAGVVELQRILVSLQAVGENKIGVIKVVRQATNAGLREAKDFVESKMPRAIAVLEPPAADALKRALEGVGATVAVTKA